MREINYAWRRLETVKRFDGEISLADKLAKKARILFVVWETREGIFIRRQLRWFGQHHQHTWPPSLRATLRLLL